jgi:hypothetical protein
MYPHYNHKTPLSDTPVVMHRRKNSGPLPPILPNPSTNDVFLCVCTVEGMRVLVDMEELLRTWLFCYNELVKTFSTLELDWCFVNIREG